MDSLLLLAALTLGAFILALHEVTPNQAHAIEKQQALQVIHLVLKSTR
jgi:hypothetical protein